MVRERHPGTVNRILSKRPVQVGDTSTQAMGNFRIVVLNRLPALSFTDSTVSRVTLFVHACKITCFGFSSIKVWIHGLSETTKFC